MAAYETCSKKVLVRREKGGNERKDIKRYSIYGNEGVFPLADGGQRGRDILLKLRDLFNDEAEEEVSSGYPKTPMITCNIPWRKFHAFQLLVQGEDELRNRQALSGIEFWVHQGSEGSW